MYAKPNTQNSRRTPLSLSGATSKQHSFLPRPTGNLNDIVSNVKNDNKTTTTAATQKTDQAAATQPTNNKPNRQPSNSDKKLQQSAAKASNISEKSTVSTKKQEKTDEKKTQNGMEKPINGKEANAADSLKEKKDHKEILTAVDKKEKLEKDHDKKKPLQKQSEQENKGRKEEGEKKEGHHKKPRSPAETERSVDKEKPKDLRQEKKQEKEEVEKAQVEPKKKEEEQDKELQEKAVATGEKKDGNLQQLQVAATEIVEISADKKKDSLTDSLSVKNIDDSLTHEEQGVEAVVPTTASPNISDRKRSSFTLSQTISASTATTIKSTTTTIDDDDIEMESRPAEETTPKKTQSAAEKQPTAPMVPQLPTGVPPTATSTPGKFLSFREIFSRESPKATQAPQKVDNKPSDNGVKYAQSFTQISGRRSIRPFTDSYTPSYFQSNTLCRESYRRINTELDVSSTTNTSLNVTVGSEVPNNSSFSFFGRGRKRELTPPKPDSRDPELEISLKSPKRARMDMHGLLSVVASPLTLLRSRFSKTSIQSSTPVNLHSSAAKELSTVAAEDEGEVQNVSGASVEENVEQAASANDSLATEDVTVGKNDGHEKDTSEKSSLSAEGGSGDGMDVDVDDNVAEENVLLKKCSAEKVIETACDEQTTGNEGINSETREMEQCGAPAKNRRCTVM